MSKGDLLEQPSLHEQEEYFKRILKELQLEGIVSVGKSKVCPGKGENNFVYLFAFLKIDSYLSINWDPDQKLEMSANLISN